jgi:hypothetical protein
MRAVIRRLQRLEERCVPQVDLASQRLADLIRDRRRRRLEASGQPFDDLVSETMSPAPGGRCLSVAEMLRMCRQRRLERSRVLEGERDSSAT